jgi:DNA polymerase
MLQLPELFPELDRLHSKYGSSNCTPIYGAGLITNPRVALVFMIPTARNVSSSPYWEGIRAPWIGTKNVWRMLSKLGLFTSADIAERIQSRKPEEWTTEFAQEVYESVANDSLYITNVSKATQDDARHIPDSVYKEFLPSIIKELSLVNPTVIIAFGNQVSSTLLQRKISVSEYLGDEYEELETLQGNTLKVYPTYYPVGQGTRNIDKALKRISLALSSL